MTDVRPRNVPPPSPYWKGPLAAADRPPVAPVYGSDRMHPEARSLYVPGLLARVLLTIQIAGLLAIAIAFLVQQGWWAEWNELAGKYTSGDRITEIMAHRHADLYGFGTGLVILLVVNGVLFFFTFLWWFQRAYRNLAKQEIHPLWLYFGWFVPIVNLWKPKQLANRIWRGSMSWELGRCVQWWWFGPYALLLTYPVGWLILFFGGANGDFGVIGVVVAMNLALQATVPMALFQMIGVVTRAQDPLILAAAARAESEPPA